LSPDGRALATGSKDGTVQVWEVASGQQVLSFSGHEADVNCLAFAPDGRSLASGSRDFTILLWDATVPESHRPTKQWQGLWDRLAGKDAADARLALWEMVRVPGKSVESLRSRLRPVATVSQERIRKLIDDLDSDRFTERQRASQDLERLGEVATPLLRKALEGRPSLEVRLRATALLTMAEGIPSLLLLRDIRAVEVLERIGSKQAVALLREIAAGAEQARLTLEAKKALRRLSKTR
jgi:hypothetical protein